MADAVTGPSGSSPAGMDGTGQLAAIESEREARRSAWRRAGIHRGLNMVDAFHEGLETRHSAQLRFLAEGHQRDLTLRQLYDEGAAVATVLTQVGVRPGARIALHVPNWPEQMIALYAAQLLRAVVVPIPAIYGPTEVRFILEDAGVDTYILADRWRKQGYLGSLSQVSTAASLERVIVVGDEVPAGCIAWADIAARAAGAVPTPLEAHRAGSQSLSFVIYTSGSTANPKGGQHSHDTFLAEFEQNRAKMSIPGPHLQTFPGGHVAGLLGMLRPLLFGQDTVIMDHWDADLAASLISDLGITSTSGAPFYLTTLLDAADKQGAGLHTIADMLVGSAAVPPALVERAEAAGFRPYRCYGSTEHPTISSNLPSDSMQDRSQTDGALLTGVEVQIVDEDGRRLGAGSEGEILSRGPDQFLCYTDPAANREVLTAGGWFRTGDIGYLTPSGRLVISDRKKDVIIRGGENLSSQEIEAILVRHPAVAQVAVIGLPDPRYGERPGAVVVLRPGRALSLDEVRAHFGAAGVARQKTPEMLVIRPELPRTAAGKVQKFRLREEITLAMRDGGQAFG